MYKEILNKILLSTKPSCGIMQLIESEEMYNIIPEIMKMKGFQQHTPYHDKDVLNHTLAVLDSIKPKLNLRMAALLHDVGKPDCFTIDDKGIGHFHGHHIKSAQMTDVILNRLGYNINFINNVKILIRYHYYKDLKIKDNGVEALVHNVGKENLNDLFELIKADTMGKSNPNNFENVNNLIVMCGDFLKEQNNFLKEQNNC